MYTREVISFDPSVDMRTSYGEDLFKSGIIVGENSNIMYGPYVSLPAGRWTVSVSGQVDGEGPFYIDGAAELGKVILGVGYWSDGRCTFEMDCPFPVDKLEIRAFAAPGSFVRIDGVSVERQYDRKKARSFSIVDRMGMSLLLDPTSWVDRCVIETGGWEVGHLNYLTQNATRYANGSRDMVFLDIGAYFGLYSLVMSRTNVFGRIVAFEADKLNFRQLCANLLLNDPNCLIEPRFVAISDKSGSAVFESAMDHPDGNRGGVGVNEDNPLSITDDSRLIHTDKIDNLLPLENRRIFAKIDVEGHELKVLAGMCDLIAKNKIFLQVETFAKLDEVKQILQPLGCRLVHQLEVDYFFTNFEEDPFNS